MSTRKKSANSIHKSQLSYSTNESNNESNYESNNNQRMNRHILKITNQLKKSNDTKILDLLNFITDNKDSIIVNIDDIHKYPDIKINIKKNYAIIINLIDTYIKSPNKYYELIFTIYEYILYLEIISLTLVNPTIQIKENELPLSLKITIYTTALTKYQSNINIINNDLMKPLKNLISVIMYYITEIIKFESNESHIYNILKEITTFFINETSKILNPNIITNNMDNLDDAILKMMIHIKKKEPYNLLKKMRNVISEKKDQYTITNKVYDIIDEQLYKGIPMTDAVHSAYIYMRKKKIPESILIPIFTPFYVTSTISNSLYQPYKMMRNIIF